MSDIKTIVARYSDILCSDRGRDISTIDEHSKIIKKSCKVFWGWWKKGEEYDHHKELEKLKAECPIEIGLIARDAEEFSKAICTNIHLSTGNDERIPTPDKKYTPEYYESHSFPAWFELTSIDPVEKEEFEELFFGIPHGDPTLFDVTSDKIIQSVIKKIDIEKLCKVNGNSILHLSDIHFGTDHDYKDTINSVKPETLIDVIKKSLDAYKEDIGIVVVSGDFISRANKDQAINSYEDALVFLKKLARYLKMHTRDFVIVPGNHDMPLLKDDHNPYQEGNYTSSYRDFRHSLKGTGERKEIEYWAGYTTPNGWNLIFSCFNSAELKKTYLANHGYLEKKKYVNVFNNLKKSLLHNNQELFIENKIINFAVIHHQLKMFMPTQTISMPSLTGTKSSRQSLSILLNAGMFEEDAIEAGMHFLLHGHQHLPYVGSSGIIDGNKRKNLNILSAGSAGSILAAGYPKHAPYNSFNIYTPEDEHLKVRIEKYTDRGRCGCHDTFSVPYL